VFENDRGENDDEKKQHVDLARWARRLGILQDNLQDDIAGIAATIDHLFEQFVKVAQKDDVFGIVIGLVKIAQKLQFQFVSLSFDGLQLRVHFARGANVHSFAQLLYHREDRLGGLIEEMDLLRETRYRQVLRGNHHSFADFFDRLRYFVERSRERLNV